MAFLYFDGIALIHPRKTSASSAVSYASNTSASGITECMCRYISVCMCHHKINSPNELHQLRRKRMKWRSSQINQDNRSFQLVLGSSFPSDSDLRNAAIHVPNLFPMKSSSS